MYRFLIAAAAALALSGCATANSGPAAEGDARAEKSERVCTNRDMSETGSRMKRRTCRSVQKAAGDGE